MVAAIRRLNHLRVALIPTEFTRHGEVRHHETQRSTNKMSTQDPRAGVPSASKFSTVVDCPGQDQFYRRLLREGKIALDIAPDHDASFGVAVHEARRTGNTLNLDAEQLAAYEHGMSIERKILAQWRADYGIKDYREIPPMSERLFLHHPETLDPVASGEIDVLYIAEPRALIVDWKALGGYYTPPAKRNEQLRVYGVCAWKNYDGIENLRVAIDRCNERESTEDYCTYTLTDLKNSEQSIMYHLWYAQQESAPRRPGPQCHFCPCAANCPEAGAMALLPTVIARRALNNQSVDVEDMVAAMSHEDLLKVWDMSGVVEKIIKAVDARLKLLSKEELNRLGLELPAEGKVRDAVKDVKGAFAFLRDAQNLPEDKLWAALGLAKGKVSEILQSERSMAKKWADKLATELLEKFSERTHDKPSLKEIKGI